MSFPTCFHCIFFRHGIKKYYNRFYLTFPLKMKWGGGFCGGWFVGLCHMHMLIRIQMTFSQPAYYSVCFLAFKSWGRKQSSGCEQDTADDRGQRASHWKHGPELRVNSGALDVSIHTEELSATTQQSNTRCCKDLITITTPGTQCSPLLIILLL